MASISLSVVIISFIITLYCSCLVDAKVFMVLIEDNPVISHSRSDEDIKMYKESIISKHDVFLESLLPHGSYTKLYSYTHLLNGFAVHITSKEVLEKIQGASGVRAIHEDIKMTKMTTHTPELLGIPQRVWPELGGAKNAGQGVVIGVIDTGINPFHPSFKRRHMRGHHFKSSHSLTRFKGKCDVGDHFPESACHGKIAGAQYFARAAIAAGEFNASRDYASPFDADGHGSHTASTAAGNHHIPVIVNDYNYGHASGMAPGARLAVYKALYSFGGYMSDVVAAVDQAVEDGVDILSLSIGPATVPQGPSAFLNVLEMELLFATRAGVLVVQAVGNGGPAPSSILSFSPWITSVAASLTDRKYTNSIHLSNGQSFPGTGLSPPTTKDFQIAAAVDVCDNKSSYEPVQSCQSVEPFILSKVKKKLIICTYTYNFEYGLASIATVADTVRRIGAAGFIVVMDSGIVSDRVKGATLTFPVPGIVISRMEASSALWHFYNMNTKRDGNGQVMAFEATARIGEGRHAVYTEKAPIVASYSSRGPDLSNALLQTADVLKPNIMAPGSSIWAAWSPNSEGDPHNKGQKFALVSGTSMATPHVAGVAALIKQKHPDWTPAAITSAMMTTAHVVDRNGNPILAQRQDKLAVGTPFDFGAGFINPTRAIDPGLVFDAEFSHYIQFLCAVPGVDEKSVRRATGLGCPKGKSIGCSELNSASVIVSNLMGSKTVVRRVSNVGGMKETYSMRVQEPTGVVVSVSPRTFTVSPNATKSVRIMVQAKEATSGYTFGEVFLMGNEGHTVRLPLAVNVISTINT